MYNRRNWTEKLLLQDSDQNEFRQSVLEILRRELDNGPRGIFYLLYHIDQFGLKLKDWPEVRSWIDEYKTQIIRELLSYIEDNEVDDILLNRLLNIGVDWPQLSIIQDALSKDKHK